MLYAQVIVKKKTRVEELTYIVPAKIIPYIKKGMIVTVPLRRKCVTAVVVKLISRVEARLKPKLREILSVDKNRRILPEAIASIQKLADYYGAPLAEVASHALKVTNQGELIDGSVGRTRPIFLQGPIIRRFKAYLELVTRLDNRRALFLFAVRAHAAEFSRQLDALADHKRLIVGTVGQAFYPLASGDLIVVDQPYHVGAVSKQRPFMSNRRIAEIRSQAEHLQLVFGNALISVEDFLRLKDGWQLRDLSEAPLSAFICDQRGSKEIIMPSLVERLKKAVSAKRRILALVLSRGLAPTLICFECGQVFRCRYCSRHIALYPQGLICPYCGETQPEASRCPTCGSVRLKGIGEGVVKFVNYLKKLLPSVLIQQLSIDLPELDPKSQIVVATEKILSFPSAQFNELFVLSADRLLSGIELNGNWRLLESLIELRSRIDFMGVQTYFPDHPVWGYLASGNWSEYFQSELKERRDLSLPPFATFFNLVGQAPTVQVAMLQANEIGKRLKKLLPSADTAPPEILGRSGRKFRVRLQVLTTDRLTTDLKKTITAEILPSSWGLIIT